MIEYIIVLSGILLLNQFEANPSTSTKQANVKRSTPDVA
jgi:hypothetical protein